MSISESRGLLGGLPQQRLRGALLMLALLFGGWGSAAAQTLKIATVAPDGSAWMKAMREAAEQVKRDTEGRVTVKYFPGGVMGADATVLKKIKLGQLQGGAVTASELSGLSRNVQIYGLPFLFRDAAEIDAARAEFDARIAADLKASGFTMLSLSGVGFAYLMSNGEIADRAQLESRKVWVPQNDAIAERTFRAGGISPIPLPLPDVFTALQTGLVDTVGNTPAGAIALQWHGGLKQVLDLPLSYIAGYVVVDNRAFGKLAESDQAAVLAAFAAAGKRIDADNRRSDGEALKALQGLGVALVAPAPAEIARWEQAGREVVDALAAEGALEPSTISALRALLERRRGKG